MTVAHRRPCALVDLGQNRDGAAQVVGLRALIQHVVTVRAQVEHDVG